MLIFSILYTFNINDFFNDIVFENINKTYENHVQYRMYKKNCLYYSSIDKFFNFNEFYKFLSIL